MNTLEAPSSKATALAKPCPVLEAARKACQRIAPLWPLQNFVAVNPFLGLSDRPFIEACDLMRRVAPGGMQMPISFYQEKYASGEITDSDLNAALALAKKVLPAPWVAAVTQLTEADLKKSLSEGSPATAGILSVAEAVDETHGTAWATAVTETIAQFCSEYYDAGQSAWQLPWRNLSLYKAWREKALININAEVLGLRQFRQLVKALPETAAEALVQLHNRLNIAPENAADFFHHQLMSIRGWAGHVQYRVRENSMNGQSDDSLVELLAIRLAYDAALLSQYDGPALREFWSVPCPGESAHLLPTFLWQLAHEQAWQHRLLAQLQQNQAQPKSSRPSTQAVFCIDVRSEIFRRSLEQTSAQIETLGFAGFFGMAIEAIPFGQHRGTAHCPVLLRPKFRVRETLRYAAPEMLDAAWQRQRRNKRLSYSWNSFKTSAISCFSFVETTGLAYGAKLFREAFAPKTSPLRCCTHAPQLEPSASDSTGIAPEERTQLAYGALRHMGLTKNFARLVLLCGHGSQTANNPYSASLDCGACGGHAGDSNARIAAAILNDSDVRAALVAKGITIPEDTQFLAGLHNTTTDEVILFDTETLPASHRADLSELQAHLNNATQACRRERSARLGLDQTAPDLEQQILARSADWAQIRPEWGLAGNAAFIASPRHRTQAAQLDGRVFLHNYDHRTDDGDSTLELIMIAPMVVANWINLQYYGSTVNNQLFGSGNKVIHNVVGTLGVCQGNGGDLQTGLPLQSLHDGEKWVHEPLRLQVYIEAPHQRIQTILDKHEQVRQLAENGWLRLFAIEDEGKTYRQYFPGASWEKVEL